MQQQRPAAASLNTAGESAIRNSRFNFIIIIAEENERGNKYFVEIANVVKEFQVDDDWNFSFDEKAGVFNVGVCIKSKIKKINYLIRVHSNDCP